MAAVRDDAGDGLAHHRRSERPIEPLLLDDGRLGNAHSSCEGAYRVATCALVRKEGVCFQCAELDESSGARRGNPLASTDGTLEARLNVLRELREHPTTTGHRVVLKVLDDVQD